MLYLESQLWSVECSMCGNLINRTDGNMKYWGFVGTVHREG